MELRLLNKDLIDIAVIDKFQSLIWTDRYVGYGDVDLVENTNESLIPNLQLGYYLHYDESEHLMIIDDLGIHTDREDGTNVIVRGKSLENILNYRIIWSYTVLTGNLQLEIQKLLNENAISPTDPNRAISRLIFEPSTDPAITELTVDAQFMGESLYSAIQALCAANNIGFKIVPNSSGQFVFKLYAGKDRSYDQITNPYVIFSPDYDNLANSDYRQSDELLRTVALIAGEGEGASKVLIAVSFDAPGSDLDRREIFVDASSVTRNTPEGELTDQEYVSQIAQKGAETLSEHVTIKTFEGEADASQMFIFGEDFFMGDIVQVENEYGFQSKSRITEYIRSQDRTGVKFYPTFSSPYI